MAVQDHHFSDNLTYYRKKTGLLQKQLAKELGVSTSAVSNWESGINFPRLDTVYNICNVLDITLGQLLGIDKTQFDEEDLALIRAYKQNPSMQAAVRRLLRLD